MIPFENHCNHLEVEGYKSPQLHKDVLAHLESLLDWTRCDREVSKVIHCLLLFWNQEPERSCLRLVDEHDVEHVLNPVPRQSDLPKSVL